MFPAGLDFLKAFFGCVYAGLVAIPAPAPETSRRKRTLPRLRSIASDADVKCILSVGETCTLVRETCALTPDLEAIPCVDIAAIPEEAAGAWRPPAIAADDLAYLQYTSGSTTAPKGVMLSHHNVLHHCRDLRAKCGYDADSISVTWLPYFHDYGLIEGLLVPLQNGTPCYVMSPFAFLRRPFAWLNAISRYRGTHTQAPNFAYDQCVRRVKPEQLAQLDLTCLRNAGNGAEPINPLVVEALVEMFGPQGLRSDALSPAYGLAEATLMMTCCPPGQVPRATGFRTDALTEGRVVAEEGEAPAIRRVVSCGAPLGNIRIEIVDPDSHAQLGPGHVGEVWISDPCVALGYWKREEATAETFRAHTTAGDGPFLRTGDLGFMHEGELYLSGRLKDLIIIGGANHHPQDIEWTVEASHAAVRPGHCAATSDHLKGEERLIVALETERGALTDPAETEDLVGAIQRAVTEAHEVPVHAVVLLQRGSLPKTASGKIQRHVCAKLLGQPTPDVLALWERGVGLTVPRFESGDELEGAAE
jgi:acyl-CoA synthetase (AMP-forming)/AMP-acid ligase II